MITVYRYDGTPIDIWHESEMPEDSTLIPPTDGLYEPRKFDPETETWSGLSKEEWEQNLPVENEYPTNNENDEIDEMKKRIDYLENLVKQLLEGTD